MERCPARLRAECPLSRVACGIITHHIFWPRRDYEDGGAIPSQFRELAENKVPMCKAEEIELHKGEPPPMPSFKVMRHVVETQKLRRDLAARPLRKP